MLFSAKAIIDDLMERHEVRDQNKLIEKLLEQFQGMSVREQLFSRKIIQVYPRTITGARIFPTEGGFLVYLNGDCEEEWPEDLGHELAHTFFYDLEPNPPLWLTGCRNDDEEEFCEAFALRWATVNRAELEPIIKQFKEKEQGGG